MSLPSSFVAPLNQIIAGTCEIPVYKKKEKCPGTLARIENNDDRELLKVKIFKLIANYNICIERDHLLHQRIKELVEDINYYRDELKKIDPNIPLEELMEELEPVQKNIDLTERKLIDDINFEF